jgi:hypothetical protein
MTALVAVAASYHVAVDGFPVDPHESGGAAGGTGRADAGGPFRRTVELRAASHVEAAAIATLLDGQAAPYRPVRIDVHDDGALTVTYSPAALG